MQVGRDKSVFHVPPPTLLLCIPSCRHTFFRGLAYAFGEHVCTRTSTDLTTARELRLGVENTPASGREGGGCLARRRPWRSRRHARRRSSCVRADDKDTANDTVVNGTDGASESFIMFPSTFGVFVILIFASFLLEQQRGLCSADDWDKGIIVSPAGATQEKNDDREPGFWASFRTYVLGEHDVERHGWHHRFFNRYIPLFGVITLTLVAVALCLSYWCQDRNSVDTESSRAYLEELRRIQQGERVAMYPIPPGGHSYGAHPDYHRPEYYYPPPQYNYATFDGGTKPPPSAPPPAYQPH